MSPLPIEVHVLMEDCDGERTEVMAVYTAACDAEHSMASLRDAAQTTGVAGTHRYRLVTVTLDSGEKLPHSGVAPWGIVPRAGRGEYAERYFWPETHVPAGHLCQRCMDDLELAADDRPGDHPGPRLGAAAGCVVAVSGVEKWLKPYVAPTVMTFSRDHALDLEEYQELVEWAQNNNVDLRVPPHLRPQFPVYTPQVNLNDVGKDVDGYRPYLAIAFIVAVILLAVYAVLAWLS